MQSRSAFAALSPPPVPVEPVNETSRRIVRTVSIYRAACATILFTLALILDLKTINVAAPNAFLAAAGLYFVYGVSTSMWLRRNLLPAPLPVLMSSLLAGDILFIVLVTIASGGSGGPLPILLFPQLAASGWLLRARIAFFHASVATVVLLGLDVWRLMDAQISAAQPFQTGLIGFGYFTTVVISVALGSYAKASEDLAAQRGIDVANLEQVNRLIIQDMQDGVLVVDRGGIVRSHNAQVTRLLGGFGQMRGGMPLAAFSLPLDAYWRRWQGDDQDAPSPLRIEATQRLLRVRLVQIGSGNNSGTLIYLEDLGRAQVEAQQMKLAAMGRLTASIAHEVRNPLSAINQAAQLLEEDRAVNAGGERLLAMIRNNAKRIDRIVGEVLQLNRRDRQDPETIDLADFMQSIVDEIVQAEKMPPGVVVLEIPTNLMVLFDRGHLHQIVWNLVSNAWQHCQKTAGSIRVGARAGYMGDAVLCELDDDGPGIKADQHGQIFEPFFTTRSGGTGLGLYIARELADANGAALDLLPRSPGAHFRITLRRAIPHSSKNPAKPANA